MMRKRSNGLTLTFAIAVLMLGAAAAGIAQRFSEAEIFLELNDTDEDLGIHASIDGEPWTSLKVVGPEGLLLDIFTREGFRTQGLTQFSFESAEPAFDELSPARFFRRFPEGRYAISAKTESGHSIRGAASLSHVLAAPPENILLNGIPAADSCEDPPPTVIAPVMITWDPVTGSHPRVGKRGPVRIVQYQLFVEGEGTNLAITLPASITQFEVPMAVTDGGEQFKFGSSLARAPATTPRSKAVSGCSRALAERQRRFWVWLLLVRVLRSGFRVPVRRSFAVAALEPGTRRTGTWNRNHKFDNVSSFPSV